jgi:cell division protein FtsB
MAGSMRGGASRGHRSGAAGRTPGTSKTGAGRKGPSPVRRSRAALPRREAAVGAAAARKRRTTLTARAAVLAVALASVALAVALPFKIWLGQRGEISTLQAQTRAQQQHVAQLQHQQQQWQDPAYVEQQARLRLHYVLPGEKAYIVLGRTRPKAPKAGQAPAVPAVTGAWYSRLWQTVELAGK